MNMSEFTEKYGSFYKFPWFPEDLIPEFENHLLSLPWETKRTARHEYFMSNKDLTYSYGGQDDIVYNAKPFSLPVSDVCETLNKELGVEFNACFLNKYDDEKQHLGWHADDFAEMREDQPIAVVSFGAEREIWVKKKRIECPDCKGTFMKLNGAVCNCEDGTIVNKGPIPKDQRILLQRGSLFVMPIGYQDNYFHRIPKHDRPCSWRISLTFRSFK